MYVHYSYTLSSLENTFNLLNKFSTKNFNKTNNKKYIVSSTEHSRTSQHFYQFVLLFIQQFIFLYCLLRRNRAENYISSCSTMHTIAFLLSYLAATSLFFINFSSATVFHVPMVVLCALCALQLPVRERLIRN